MFDGLQQRCRNAKNNSIGDPTETLNDFFSKAWDMEGLNWRLNESAMAFVSSELGPPRGNLGYQSLCASSLLLGGVVTLWLSGKGLVGV
jgi:hypothetical protein